MDRYEITIGRFRAWLGGYPGKKPAPGSGRNPNNPNDPGWKEEWSAFLPPDAASIEAGFTNEAGTGRLVPGV
jgi:hypothetical protein